MAFILSHKRKLTLLALDREMAYMAGINPDLYQLLLYLMLACALVLGHPRAGSGPGQRHPDHPGLDRPAAQPFVQGADLVDGRHRRVHRPRRTAAGLFFEFARPAR